MVLNKSDWAKVFLAVLAFIVICVVLATFLPDSKTSRLNNYKIKMMEHSKEFGRMKDENDLTRVKCAHAVNSRQLLDIALKGKIMELI